MTLFASSFITSMSYHNQDANNRNSRYEIHDDYAGYNVNQHNYRAIETFGQQYWTNNTFRDLEQRYLNNGSRRHIDPRGPNRHTPQNQYLSSKSSDYIHYMRHDINYMKKGTIYFSAAVKADTLIGSCAWWILDQNGKALSSGAIPVAQDFSNSIRLEYKALFHALNAANINGVRIAVIRSSCPILIDSIIRKFDDNNNMPYFSTVYHSIRDLRAPLKSALDRLYSYSIEYVEPDSNSFCQRLATRTVLKYEKRNIIDIINMKQAKKPTS